MTGLPLLSVLAVALGFTAGLRSMTAPAVVAWAARLGWLDLADTPLAFLASTPVSYVLAAAMIGELIADKLPFTPNRTRSGPFTARVVSGGLAAAALVAASGGPLALGAALGAIGGATGTIVGFRTRTGLVRRWSVPDYVVAIMEDAFAVLGAILIVMA